VNTRNRAIVLAGLAAFVFGLGLSLLTPTGKVIAQYVETTVAQIATPPSPSPSPVPAFEAGVVTVTPAPIATPVTPPVIAPTAPPVENFPNPAPVIVTPGQPAPPPLPQTMVTVSTGSTMPSDVNTGGIICKAPCTIDWRACFQGGFTGSLVQLCGPSLTDPTLTFTWSDGAVGPVHIATYTSAGTFKVTVSVTEAYQGHIYAAGSANAVPVTVT
jgi:hypothetical protein